MAGSTDQNGLQNLGVQAKGNCTLNMKADSDFLQLSPPSSAAFDGDSVSFCSKGSRHCCSCRKERSVIVIVCFVLLLVTGSVWWRYWQLDEDVEGLRLQVKFLMQQCEKQGNQFERKDSNVFASGPVTLVQPLGPADSEDLRQANPDDGDETRHDSYYRLVYPMITSDEAVITNDDTHRTKLNRVRRKASGTPSGNGKNGAKNPKPLKPAKNECSKALDCIKNKGAKPTKQCEKIMNCPGLIPDNGIEAVHYHSDHWKSVRQEDYGKVPWTNRLPLTSLTSLDTPIKFLHPADWMKHKYTEKTQQPILEDQNGGYQVKKSGLYLIYISVLFHDVKPRQAFALVINGTRLFKCMDSVDYIDKDLPPDINQAKYKSCTLTAMTQLKTGDRMEVWNLYENTEIDMSPDASYFGAVRLSG